MTPPTPPESGRFTRRRDPTADPANPTDDVGVRDATAPTDATGSQGPHRDPMASDRRVLIIGLVSMLLFVTVGVTSASLFTVSACRDIAGAQPAAFDPAAIVAVQANNLDTLTGVAPSAVADVDAFEALAGPNAALWLPAERYQPHAIAGYNAGIWQLRDANSLVTLSDDASQVVVPDAATLVGSGDTLFALALTNLLTGQVDAVQPISADGDASECVDTALARVPLAFYLDAHDGQLVMLRVDEGGQDPQIELLNADATIAWRSPVTSPIAPPGVLGERITAAAGTQAILVGRRFTDGDDTAVIALFERHDGASRWDIAGIELAPHVPSAGAYRTTALAVGETYAFVAVAGEDEPDGSVTVVAVSVADGEIVWSATLAAMPTWSDSIDDRLLASIDGQLWTVADGAVADTGVAGLRHLRVVDGLQVLLERDDGTLALAW